MPYTDELVHSGTGHVLRDDDGARYTEDLAETGLAVLISDPGEVLLRIWECAGHGWEGEWGSMSKARVSWLLDERRQGRLTTVVPFWYSIGSCDQSLAAPKDGNSCIQRLHGRLRVD